MILVKINISVYMNYHLEKCMMQNIS